MKQEEDTSKSNVFEKIKVVRAEIDASKEIYGVDLVAPYLELLSVSMMLLERVSRKYTDAFPPRISEIYLRKIQEAEFKAYKEILEKLLKQASEYASKLEESLINVSELLRAVNRAKRHLNKATACFYEEGKRDEAINIAKREVENVAEARTDMEARESEEKRKVSFKLVTYFLAFFTAILVPYFTYMVGFLHADPLNPNSVLGLLLLYLIGCFTIYVAIGYLSRVKPKGVD